jgi:hypothetical protein
VPDDIGVGAAPAHACVAAPHHRRCRPRRHWLRRPPAGGDRVAWDSPCAIGCPRGPCPCIWSDPMPCPCLSVLIHNRTRPPTYACALFSGILLGIDLDGLACVPLFYPYAMLLSIHGANSNSGRTRSSFLASAATRSRCHSPRTTVMPSLAAQGTSRASCASWSRPPTASGQRQPEACQYCERGGSPGPMEPYRV